MKLIIWLLCCIVIMPLVAHAGELYRWMDSSGIMHYSDVPTADAEKIDSKKLSDEVTPNENLPYETRRAQQNFPVILYVGSGCGELCNQARLLLNKRGIPFIEKVLSTKDEINAFRQLANSEIVPTLAVGKAILKGFESKQWHGELDIAGYPKIAPYRTSASPANPAAASQIVPANPAVQ